MIDVLMFALALNAVATLEPPAQDVAVTRISSPEKALRLGRQITIAAMAPEQVPEVRRRRTTAVFEFEAVTPTTTKVTLVQTGWQPGREWDDAYEYLAGGNATLLRQLQKRFLTGPINWPTAH